MFQAIAKLFTFSNLQRIVSAVSVVTQAVDSVVNVIRIAAPATATKVDDNLVAKYDASKTYVEKNLDAAIKQAEKLKEWGMLKSQAEVIDKVIYLLQKSFQSKAPGEILSEDALKAIEEKVRAKIAG